MQNYINPIELLNLRTDISSGIDGLTIRRAKKTLLAEIELNDENEEIQLPTWIGEEVTNDPAYLNVNLFKNL